MVLKFERRQRLVHQQRLPRKTPLQVEELCWHHWSKECCIGCLMWKKRMIGELGRSRPVPVEQKLGTWPWIAAVKEHVLLFLLCDWQYLLKKTAVAPSRKSVRPWVESLAMEAVGSYPRQTLASRSLGALTWWCSSISLHLPNNFVFNFQLIFETHRIFFKGSPKFPRMASPDTQMLLDVY